MGLLTKQDIDNYYRNYKSDEIVFNKSITNLLGIQPKHIYLKYKDTQRPCIIYSSSMTKAKVIASLPPEVLKELQAEHSINLRFAVKNEEKKNDSIFFFIKCKIVDLTTYRPEQNLFLIDFSFINKPPETLIILLGRVLEAKKNSVNRSDDRIIINKEEANNLGLLSTAVKLSIDNIPRQAIIRDISFSGMKLLLAGNAKFLNNKTIKVSFQHKIYNEIILLGKSTRSESLVNRKDIVVLAVQFDKKTVPVEYNLLINEYIKSHKIMNKIKTNIEAKEIEENSI